jgi:hypothetical protein
MAAAGAKRTLWCCQSINKCRNTGMPRKSHYGMDILAGSQCVNPASAFQSQGQSVIAGHGLVRHCPALDNRHWLATDECGFNYKSRAQNATPTLSKLPTHPSSM